MNKGCQKKYGLRFKISFRKRYSRVIVGIILLTLLLQCCPSVFMGRFGEYFSQKVSAENMEILSDHNSTELYDGVNGEIVVDLDMPDFIFSPEEDGAWALDLYGETKGDPIFTFDVLLYEWHYGNTWARIDHLNGPGASYGENGIVFNRKFIPQYYQKGHVYRIKFRPVEYNSSANADYLKMQYTLQKTEFAGCYNGLIWRTNNNWVGYGNNDAAENIRCIRYIGNETILQVPDRIEGHLITAIGSEGGFHSISNEDLQVLILGEYVEAVESLAECRNLKDIYSYNIDCNLLNNVLPRFYVEGGGSYYDTVIHGYAGGKLERDCKEMGCQFEPLSESASLSPDSSDISTPQPSTAAGCNTPLPAPTETPDVAASTLDNIQMPTPQPTESDISSTLPTETGTLDPGISTSQPTPLPSANGSAASVAAAVPLVKSAVIPALPGLKVSTDHYTRVTLTWKAIPGAAYQIYRATSRDSGYKQLKQGVTKTRYQDTTVKSGKFYYYRVCAVKTERGRQIVAAESRTKRVKIRALARPTIQIQKKLAGNIRYLVIRLKKYQGKRVEIYYKESQWSPYRKIKLYESRIGKSKRTFRIQCMSTKKSLYLKVRTYQKRKKKKVYSTYTKEKKISI